MKKLTPELRQALTAELAIYNTFTLQTRKLEVGTDKWYEAVKARNHSYDLMRDLTGLPLKTLDKLVNGYINFEHIWTATGEIR